MKFFFLKVGAKWRIFRMGKERVDEKAIEGSEWTMPIRI